MPKTIAAPATREARDSAVNRAIDVAVMARDRWPKSLAHQRPREMTLPLFVPIIKSVYWGGLNGKISTA